MTDERLRRLSRGAGADDDARARWITERLRAGTLARRRVELAAWLGDGAARLALGDDAPTLAPLPHARASRGVTARRDVQAWADDLARFGKGALVRATLALAEVSGVEELERTSLAPARAALAAARTWLRAAEAAEARQEEEPDLEAEQEACVLAEHEAVEAAAAEESPATDLLVLGSFSASAAAAGSAAGARDALVAAFARAVGLYGPGVDVAVRDALVEWALPA